MHFLHVVVVFEVVDEVHDFYNVFAGDFDGLLGDHGDGAGLDGVGGFESGADVGICGRFAENFEGFLGVFDVVGAGFEGGHHEFLFIGAFFGDEDLAFLFEVVGDAAGCAEVAATFFEDLAEFGGGAVTVIGEDIDHDSNACGAVAFVDDGLVGNACELAGAFFDGVGDGVLGHVLGFGFVDGVSEREVGFRAAAAVFGCDDDGF